MSENQKGLKTFEQVLKLQNIPANITLTLPCPNDVLYASSTLLPQGLPTAQEQTPCWLYQWNLCLRSECIYSMSLLKLLKNKSLLPRPLKL